MRWVKVCAALAAVATLASAVPGRAAHIQEIHGATVCVPDEDLSDDPENFIYVDGGTGMSTYADVSSAYIVVEDEEWIVAEAFVWCLEHKSGKFAPEDRCCQFAMHKPSGAVAVIWDTGKIRTEPLRRPIKSAAMLFMSQFPSKGASSHVGLDGLPRLFAEAIRRREEVEAEGE